MNTQERGKKHMPKSKVVDGPAAGKKKSIPNGNESDHGKSPEINSGLDW